MAPINKPEFLKTGDLIAIVATAGRIAPEKIDNAVDLLESWGFRVLTGKYVKDESNQFAGCDLDRTNDFQNAIDNPQVKAILCARGGYGTIRMTEKLEWKNFLKNPKWIVGYSDVTVLHSLLHNTVNTCSIHGSMPVNFPDNSGMNSSLQSLKDAMMGVKQEYRDEPHTLNRIGKAKGIIVGGNLSILYSLRGTSYDLDTRNKILFLEDLDEYLYHIDRIMQNLKLGGKLAGLKGLIIGGMNDMKDNRIPFGKTACEIIHDAVAEYNYPLCFGFPAGHMEPNKAFILGHETNLEVAAWGSRIEQ